MTESLCSCYLAALRQTLDHYRGDSLNQPMLFSFGLKVTESLVASLGPKAWPGTWWGLNREPSNFNTTS